MNSSSFSIANGTSCRGEKKIAWGKQKRRCSKCDINIARSHWARHLASKQHVNMDWAQTHKIHEYETKSTKQLERIKAQMGSRRTDYSALNEDGLREIGRELGMKNVEKKNREQLLKRINNIRSKLVTLRFRGIEYIRSLAKQLEIQNVEEKTRRELIEEIYRARNLWYCRKCKITIKDREIHETSELHMRRTGGRIEPVHHITKRGNFQRTGFKNVSENADVEPFLESVKDSVQQTVNDFMEEKGSCKAQMTLECEYKRVRIDEKEEFTDMVFHTKAIEIFNINDIENVIKAHFQDLCNKESRHQPSRGSGWILHKCKRLIVSLNAYTPLSASSYVELPKEIQSKKACINIKNTDDNLCFIYSVCCAIDTPVKDAERVYNYKKYVNDEIFRGFEYPMKLQDIPKFEKKSAKGYPSMAINVYDYNEHYEIRPLLISNRYDAEKEIDLLYIETETQSHYAYIKNLNRLVGSQLSKHKQAKYICRRCLMYFGQESRLREHLRDCKLHEAIKPIMPPSGSRVEFKNFNNKFQHPYVIYIDFECLLVPYEETPGKSKIVKTKKHVPYGFTTYLVSRVNDEYFTPTTYRASCETELENVPMKLVENLVQLMNIIKGKYENSKPLYLTVEEQIRYGKTNTCHICETVIETEKKVRDHCHLTGKYLGPAHNECNLNRKLPTKIPVFCHNLSGYDAHLFIKELYTFSEMKTSVIASTEERYINFTKDVFKYDKGYLTLSFVDTFRFINVSIEKLANNLDDRNFNHLRRFVKNNAYIRGDENEVFGILRRKGVFPYDYIDQIEKLYCREILPIDSFYNTLNNEHLKQSDYEQYLTVWEKLKVKTLGHYSDLYNIQDVLILADVFENFRNVCLQNYNLDPAYYLTAPGLAWDAMLKLTAVQLELLNDYNMYMMVEKGIRGGISQCVKRYVKANNRYVEGYNETRPENYLLYVDANNLYGWALSQYLPYGGFEWLDTRHNGVEQWKELIRGHDAESEIGYIFEVDLAYPESLHDEHRDLPLAPEHYNRKLCTTLLDKKDYVVHVQNLKYYLNKGMELVRVNRVIKFHQKPFMKPYIDFNTAKRAQSKTPFEIEFYKWMVNSVFGKTMENVRRRKDVRLCDEKGATKLARQPRFARFTIFDEDFLACHMRKQKIKFEKPIYVGFSVLDLSKHLMYGFYYEKLKKFDSTLSLCYMDTDSYFVETVVDPYKIILDNIDEFDTSNYPQNHKCYSNKNKTFVGKFKDELNGAPLSEFCGLRSKLYTYSYEEKNFVRCKGVSKCVTEKTMGMENFKNCLFKDEQEYRTMNCIRSFKHKLHTTTLTKLALSAKDDKRYIEENKVTTLPWGHYNITRN